jgi:uncharacterized membrane protein YcaP (DUF421 family)
LGEFIFDNWHALVRTVLVGILAYAGVILLLRLSGRRTLSKMNAFDLIVTVALGSILATVLLNKDVTLAQGILAFATLIGLQFIITWASVRARWVRQLATGEPALLFYRGAFLSQALRSARVTEDEVRASIRSAGVLALEDIEAVVLETDGTFSVVRPDGAAGQTSLASIAKPS